jgi:NAD(P)-dependent dehydrogenase (short-subunit alcohol dehydrogenase family)
MVGSMVGRTGVAIAVAAVVGAGLLNRARRRRSASFTSRVVLITGGSRGLGLALARRFASEGARLVLVSRTSSELDRACHELQAMGADVLAFVADLRNSDETDRLMADVLAAAGRLDVLVNNAGVIQSGPIELATIEDFQESLDIHFWAPLRLIRAALPHLPAGEGRIINISSIGGRVAVPHLIPYCVGKFALAALSDGLRSELAGDGISVLTVTPGLMRTGSHRNVKIRGQHKAEARWFALASAFSLTSMNVDRAAAEIIEASRHGRARVTPGIQARSAQVVDVLAPELSAAIATFVARWLPGPGHLRNVSAVWSRDLDLGWVASLFPSGAAARLNQPVAADEV